MFYVSKMAVGQLLWYSSQSSCFQHQRTMVRIQHLVNYLDYLIFKLTFFFVPQMLLELVAVLLVDTLITLLQGCVFKSQSYYSKSTKK